MYHYIVLSLTENNVYYTSVSKADLKREKFEESEGYELIDIANTAGKQRALKEGLKKGDYKVIVVWSSDTHTKL
jgi:hypothetical protein